MNELCLLRYCMAGKSWGSGPYQKAADVCHIVCREVKSFSLYCGLNDVMQMLQKELPQGHWSKGSHVQVSWQLLCADQTYRTQHCQRQPMAGLNEDDADLEEHIL